MENKEQYLVVFENCIPVKGVRYSVIQDNSRGKLIRIPNLLYDFIIDANRNQLKNLQMEPKYQTNLTEFVDFLISEEYAFLTDDPGRFPAISGEYESPEVVNNFILDYSPVYEHKTIEILKDLTTLGCKHLQLRFFNEAPLQYIHEILNDGLDSRLLSMDIILNYKEGITFELANTLIEEYAYLRQFQVYSVPEKYINYSRAENIKIHSGVFFTAQKIESEKSCGKIAEKTFAISTKAYFLAKKYNNCLYKKIAIDINGDIKNCPSSPIIWGNILHSSLLEVIQNTTDINHYWAITKDKVDICNVCEYKYACTDCRVYLENPDDIYSKPLKCGYNPYTAEWEEWSTNPLKQKAIDYYGMREILPEFNMKPDYVPSASPSTN